MDNIVQPFRFWCQKVLPAVYDDSLSYYELLCRVVKILNDVIKQFNDNVDNYNKLNAAFIELKAYVDNYFSELTVTEEVNKKLDSMAADGSLATLLSKYTTRVYNTVADMQADSTLAAGMTAKTLGYYAVNDGGGAEYYIAVANTEADIAVTLNNRLVAKLVSKFINVKAVGAKGNGIDDDTTNIQKAFTTKKPVFLPAGNYKVTKTLHAYNSVYGENCVIDFYGSAGNGVAILLSGNISTVYEKTNCTTSGATITFSGDISGIAVGDTIRISNTEKVSTLAREYDTKREIFKVYSVTANSVTFDREIVWDYDTVKVEKISGADGVEVSGVSVKSSNLWTEALGIQVLYATNFSIKNCCANGFDYAGIVAEESYMGNVTENKAFNSYSKSLQYGIVAQSCFNVSVRGNVCNCKRTAIDITRCSMNVSVTGNDVNGDINTHTTRFVTISNNTICGGVLIRGADTVVNGNVVTGYSETTLDVQEYGRAGGITITNNVFTGYISSAIPQNNTVVSGNTFNVYKAYLYSGKITVFRLFDEVLGEGGLDFSNNTIINLSGSKIDACFDMSLNTAKVVDHIYVVNNKIVGFDIGVQAKQAGGGTSNVLMINHNYIKANTGIVFRITNSVQIIGNIIYDNGAGKDGIYKEGVESIVETGVIIKDNIINNFATGINLYSLGVVQKAIVDSNVFNNVTTEVTNRNVKFAGRTICLKSPNNSIYQLEINDTGAISAKKL